MGDARALLGPAALTVVLGLRFALGGAGAAEAPHGPAWLAPLSLTLALAGILRRPSIPRALAPVDFMARHRYGMDALYVGLYRGFVLGFSKLVGWVDRYLVDGLVNFASALSLRGGDLLRRIQTGQAQDDLYGVAFGVLLVVVFAHWWAR